MNIYALKGHRVKCDTLSAGYNYHQEVAKKHLEIGKEYIVEKTQVYSWYTDVCLQGFPGLKFNSVFFKDVIEQTEEFDKEHSDYHRFH